MMTTEKLLRDSDAVANIDRHFATFLLREHGSPSPEIFWVAVLLSSHTRDGHICLHISDLTDADFVATKLGVERQALPVLPQAAALENALRTSPVVGSPGAYRPIILDDYGRLYLNRYWRYQELLASFIREKVSAVVEAVASPDIHLLLEKYFPATAAEQELDWQKIAAATALLKQFCVITGGPGTGKTHTVARIIAVLLEAAPGLRFRLAAPTGKAAVRLQEAIQSYRRSTDLPETIRNNFPTDVMTIHRLLGYMHNSPYFRHHARNPVAADVIIIDEASMIDLALMAKLVTALPAQARLILLGDHNQLASVEAGSVLADICGPGDLHHCSASFAAKLHDITGESCTTQADAGETPIQDAVVELQHSYRFSSQAGIGALSQAVNAGQASRAIEILEDDRFDEVSWSNDADTDLTQRVQQVFARYTDDEPPQALFEKLAEVRILCAVKEGPRGVRQVNAQIEQLIKSELQINTDTAWYAGQPILITRNAYDLRLFNGDVGIILPDADSGGRLKAYFQNPDGGIRKILPSRLPSHETAYAMTVHKSQGSEFQRVLFILPDRDTPLLTRELVYTAITRASRRVEIWGDAAILCAAVSRQIKRTSGLRHALWAG